MPAAPTPVLAGATLVMQPANPTNIMAPAENSQAIVVNDGLQSPQPITVPFNAPVWVSYDYTCEIGSGGSSMTMKLVWADHSTNEQGFTVYRDKQAIVTLPANDIT